MNVSQEDARESLSAVQDVAARTQRAVASAYANPLLILWGILLKMILLNGLAGASPDCGFCCLFTS